MYKFAIIFLIVVTMVTVYVVISKWLYYIIVQVCDGICMQWVCWSKWERNKQARDKHRPDGTNINNDYFTLDWWTWGQTYAFTHFIHTLFTHINSVKPLIDSACSAWTELQYIIDWPSSAQFSCCSCGSSPTLSHLFSIAYFSWILLDFLFFCSLYYHPTSVQYNFKTYLLWLSRMLSNFTLG